MSQKGDIVGSDSSVDRAKEKPLVPSSSDDGVAELVDDSGCFPCVGPGRDIFVRGVDGAGLGPLDPQALDEAERSALLEYRDWSEENATDIIVSEIDACDSP